MGGGGHIGGEYIGGGENTVLLFFFFLSLFHYYFLSFSFPFVVVVLFCLFVDFLAAVRNAPREKIGSLSQGKASYD